MIHPKIRPTIRPKLRKIRKIGQRQDQPTPRRERTRRKPRTAAAQPRAFGWRGKSSQAKRAELRSHQELVPGRGTRSTLPAAGARRREPSDRPKLPRSSAPTPCRRNRTRPRRWRSGQCRRTASSRSGGARARARTRPPRLEPDRRPARPKTLREFRRARRRERFRRGAWVEKISGLRTMPAEPIVSTVHATPPARPTLRIQLQAEVREPGRDHS